MAVEYLNISKAFLQKIYFSAVSVVLTILLGRLLGVDAFGQYSLAISTAFLLAGLSQSGGAMLVARETARASTKEHVFRILTASVRFSSILFFTISIIAFFLNLEVKMSFYLVCVSLAFIFLLLNLFNASTRGLGWLNAGQITEHVIWPSLFLLALTLIYLSSFHVGIIGYSKKKKQLSFSLKRRGFLRKKSKFRERFHGQREDECRPYA